MRILIGLIVIAAGAFLVIKTEWMLNNFGSIGFFDQHFGAEGGSRLGYKLIGLGLIFLGLIITTNMIGGFLEWVFGPLIRMSRTGG